MRLSTHMSTNSTHLLITHGTAILSNQDIHQVRVPIKGCQHNRCFTSLQEVEWGHLQWEMEGCKDRSLHNVIHVIHSMDFGK